MDGFVDTSQAANASRLVFDAVQSTQRACRLTFSFFVFLAGRAADMARCHSRRGLLATGVDRLRSAHRGRSCAGLFAPLSSARVRTGIFTGGMLRICVAPAAYSVCGSRRVCRARALMAAQRLRGSRAANAHGARASRTWRQASGITRRAST